VLCGYIIKADGMRIHQLAAAAAAAVECFHHRFLNIIFLPF
jgi:hypothetical protein